MGVAHVLLQQGFLKPYLLGKPVNIVQQVSLRFMGFPELLLVVSRGHEGGHVANWR